MTKQQTEKYRDRLRALTDRLGGTIAGMVDQVRTPTNGEAAGGLSNAPIHLGDVGSVAYTQELGATLMENETYIQEEAVAALDRIDRGTYGSCENCGTAIPAERLDALPYARHCVRCAEALQAGRAVNINDGRPATWLGEPGHEGLNQTGSPDRVVGRDVGRADDDVHAIGTPGGGTAEGGLAGTNAGHGDPEGIRLEDAMGRGDLDDTREGEDEQSQATSGPSGGAVGGTPANKRSRGRRSSSG